MYKRLLPTVVFLLVFIGVFLYLDQEPEVEVADVPAVSFEEVADEIEVEPEVAESAPYPEPPPDLPLRKGEEDPSEFNLAVPWTSQAPHAVWDHRDQEACEEASIYMVDQFYRGVAEGLIDPDIADAAIDDLVEEQMQLFGYFESTTAAQTADLVEMFYGYTVELITDPTVDQIKDEVLAGHPVVIPAAGQVLANPYFTPPGPEYHMLVIKGFTEDGFITNDPGTKRGENWIYEYEHFMNSIHDWVEDDILSGEKVVIVIQP